MTRPENPELKEKVFQLRRQGLTYQKIMDATGIKSKGHLDYYIRQYNWRKIVTYVPSPKK